MKWYRGIPHGLVACLGAMVLTVLCPFILLGLHHSHPYPFMFRPNPTEWFPLIDPDSYARETKILADPVVYVKSLFFWLNLAFFQFGPIGLLLSWILYGLSAKRAAQQMRPPFLYCLLLGILFDVLNLSKILISDYIPPDDLRPLRIAALYLVSGSITGIWIAWFAYRRIEPAAPFRPRFSLRTLVLMFVGWGVLLALFKTLPNSIELRPKTSLGIGAPFDRSWPTGAVKGSPMAALTDHRFLLA